MRRIWTEIRQRWLRRLLLKGIRDGNLDAMNAILSKGIDVNAVDGHGVTPMLVATSAENVPAFLLLIKYGARFPSGSALYSQVLAMSTCQSPIFHDLVVSTFDFSAAPAEVVTTTANILLDKGLHTHAVQFLCTAKAENVELTSEILRALRFNPFPSNLPNKGEIIEQLLELGLSDHFITANSDTALHTALREQQEALASRLIARGADLDAIGAEGETPLYTAVAHGMPNLVPELIRRDDSAHMSSMNDVHMLFDAIRSHNTKVVTAFLAAGGDPNSVEYDYFHYPALIAACIMGNDQAVTQLVRYGADVTRTYPRFGGILGYAVSHCSIVTVRLLLLRGASAHAPFDDLKVGFP